MRNLFRILLAVVSTTIVSCASRTVETCSLRDQIISIAKEAKGTGVKTVMLTSAVTKTKEGNVTVVVPSPIANGTFGFKKSLVGSTTVEMEIEVEEASQEEIDGSRYSLPSIGAL